MFREMGFSELMRRYIERRYYRRPIVAGLFVGAMSGILLAYYLISAIHPGIAGVLAIAFVSVVFGVVAGAVSAFLFFYAQLYRMSRIVREVCPACGGSLPKDASFCPFCGTDLR